MLFLVSKVYMVYLREGVGRCFDNAYCPPIDFKIVIWVIKMGCFDHPVHVWNVFRYLSSMNSIFDVPSFESLYMNKPKLHKIGISCWKTFWANFTMLFKCTVECMVYLYSKLDGEQQYRWMGDSGCPKVQLFSLHKSKHFTRIILM